MSTSAQRLLPSANHIADCILATSNLYYEIELDQLQLNKHCYLVNGFTLKERDEPAFYNNVEAWRYGPVIPEVYSAYKYYEDKKITHLEMCRTSLLDNREKVSERWDKLVKIIGEDVVAVISGVLKQYGKYTGGQLVEMTHGNDTPWKKVYRPGHNKIINTDIIKNFYRRLRADDIGR